MSSYYEKYLKYKEKYLRLKSLMGGDLSTGCKGKDWSFFQSSDNINITDKVLAEIDSKLKAHKAISVDDTYVYFAALEGGFVRYHGCEVDHGSKEALCTNKLKDIFNLSKKLLAEVKPLFKGKGIDLQKEFNKHCPNYSDYLSKNRGQWPITW